MSNKVSYIKELDGIRAIAALMVMVYHFFVVITFDNSFLNHANKLVGFGQTGVSLFFALSGFLISRILLSTKNADHYFRNFYIRRALRVFPLYYLALVIYYFIIPSFTNNNVSFEQQFGYWIYAQNIYTTFKFPIVGPFHFWSLAVEEHFYLFWPLIIFYFNTKSIKKIIAILLILSLILRAVLYNNGYEVFYFTFTRLDELVLGSLLAVWEREGVLNASKKWFLKWCFVLSLLLVMAIFVLFSGERLLFIQVIKFPILAIFYFSLLGLIILNSGLSKSSFLLKSSFLVFIGKISYGLYVFHPFVFTYLESAMKDEQLIIRFIASFGLTFIIAVLSYYLFESQFLRFKVYFENRKFTKEKLNLREQLIDSN